MGNKILAILKNRSIVKLKFRRQHSIGKYIVDFYCAEKGLIVELDGGHHNEADNVAFYAERQKYLEDQGYKVLRFWNNEIDDNLEGVIEKIIDS